MEQLYNISEVNVDADFIIIRVDGHGFKFKLIK